MKEASAPKKDQSGLSIAEYLIVIAIIVIISSVSVSNLVKRRSRRDLFSSKEQIISLLKDAQGRSVTQASSTSWGVHFENNTTTPDFYALFRGLPYNASNTLGFQRLPAGVSFATSSVPNGSSTDFSFYQISGLPTATGTIVLELSGGAGKPIIASTTINIEGTGLIY